MAFHVGADTAYCPGVRSKRQNCCCALAAGLDLNNYSPGLVFLQLQGLTVDSTKVAGAIPIDHTSAVKNHNAKHPINLHELRIHKSLQRAQVEVSRNSLWNPHARGIRWGLIQTVPPITVAPGGWLNCVTLLRNNSNHVHPYRRKTRHHILPEYEHRYIFGGRRSMWGTLCNANNDSLTRRH